MDSSKQNTDLPVLPGRGDLLVPNPKLRLREQLREVCRFKHYSLRTEETYWHWIERFLRFCREEGAGVSREGAKGAKGGRHIRDGVEPALTGGWRHPRELGAAEVAAFLSHLATAGKVAAATQNQALNSLVFLYGEVLHQPLGDLAEVVRVTRPARLPEVLGRESVSRLLDAVEADYQLPVRLLYGTGLRLRVRVKGFASRGFGF